MLALGTEDSQVRVIGSSPVFLPMKCGAESPSQIGLSCAEPYLPDHDVIKCPLAAPGDLYLVGTTMRWCWQEDFPLSFLVGPGASFLSPGRRHQDLLAGFGPAPDRCGRGLLQQHVVAEQAGKFHIRRTGGRENNYSKDGHQQWTKWSRHGECAFQEMGERRGPFMMPGGRSGSSNPPPPLRGCFYRRPTRARWGMAAYLRGGLFRVRFVNSSM